MSFIDDSVNIFSSRILACACNTNRNFFSIIGPYNNYWRVKSSKEQENRVQWQSTAEKIKWEKNYWFTNLDSNYESILTGYFFCLLIKKYDLCCCTRCKGKWGGGWFRVLTGQLWAHPSWRDEQIYNRWSGTVILWEMRITILCTCVVLFDCIILFVIMY